MVVDHVWTGLVQTGEAGSVRTWLSTDELWQSMKFNMFSLTFLFSLLLILLGLVFTVIYDIANKTYCNIYVFGYFLPLAGLVLMWISTLKISIDRKKEDIRKNAIQIPETKPRIAFDPKYRAIIDLPEYLSGENGSIDPLSSKLSDCGFRKLNERPDSIMYERGSIFGLFSIEKTKLKVLLETPLREFTYIYFAYGYYTIDTGDLWSFSREVIDDLIALK
jgi:hypothetical protein